MAVKMINYFALIPSNLLSSLFSKRCIFSLFSFHQSVRGPLSGAPQRWGSGPSTASVKCPDLSLWPLLNASHSRPSWFSNPYAASCSSSRCLSHISFPDTLLWVGLSGRTTAKYLFSASALRWSPLLYCIYWAHLHPLRKHPPLQSLI